MKNIFKIKQEQLGKKIGRIVPWDYVAKDNNEHVFVIYILGDIPVRICSELTYDEFKKIC